MIKQRSLPKVRELGLQNLATLNFHLQRGLLICIIRQPQDEKPEGVTRLLLPRAVSYKSLPEVHTFSLTRRGRRNCILFLFRNTSFRGGAQLLFCLCQRQESCGTVQHLDKGQITHEISSQKCQETFPLTTYV